MNNDQVWKYIYMGKMSCQQLKENNWAFDDILLYTGDKYTFICFMCNSTLLYNLVL